MFFVLQLEFVIVTLSTYINSASTYMYLLLKDTHREKALSNKTPALTKSTNMGVWAVGKLNQFLIRDS